MKEVFADTYSYLALLNDGDEAHRASILASKRIAPGIVTATWVPTEVGDAFSAPRHRGLFHSLVESLRTDPSTTVVPRTRELFEQGIDLYSHRPDKDWPLTVCIPFVEMKQHRLTDALTPDHLFNQAGFRLLLGP